MSIHCPSQLELRGDDLRSAGGLGSEANFGIRDRGSEANVGRRVELDDRARKLI